jgi:uncharacterized protein YbjT (DUF2867 family)
MTGLLRHQVVTMPERLDRVEVVQGSHSDHDVVTRAFAGADSVFWLTPPDPHADSVTAAYVDFTRPACEAFRTQGKFFSPISAGRKIPMVATRDIAVVAATLLLDDSWSGQEDVPVLGPEDLSNDDMAQIISEVLAKPTTFQQIPCAAYKARFTGFGMSDAMAQAMLDMAVAKDNGLDNAVIRTARSSTPTTFHERCEEVLKPAVLARRPPRPASHYRQAIGCPLDDRGRQSACLRRRAQRCRRRSPG